MENYKYIYKGSEGYFYPGTDILINRLNLRDENALAIAEREITSLKLLTTDIEAFDGKYEYLKKY